MAADARRIGTYCIGLHSCSNAKKQILSNSTITEGVHGKTAGPAFPKFSIAIETGKCAKNAVAENTENMVLEECYNHVVLQAFNPL